MPILYLFLFLLPSGFTQAQGLVPCDGGSEDPCQSCHVVKLIENVFGWLGDAFMFLVPLFLVVAGVILVSSVGSVGSKTSIRRFISTVIVGYIIFLASWFIVDLGMKMLVNSDTYNFWDEITCVEQPSAQKFSRVSATGFNDHIMTDTEINTIAPASSADGDLIGQASNIISDPTKRDHFKALIAQESSNCTNKVGSVAYGCGQMTIARAKELDPTLKNLSDEQIKNKLINDNAYNLNLSAKNFNLLLMQYHGDVNSALAAYNGGMGANSPSSDCPGQKRWQCVWDSPGCYNTDNNDCKPNTGFQETRNYVQNINKAVNLNN